MSVTRHPTQFLRLGRVLLAFAVCASLGLHWAALQAVAWTQMLVTYSQHAELAEAVKKTFNGENPCGLCLIVKQGRSEEKKQEALPFTKKLDAVLVREVARPMHFTQTVEFTIVEERAEGWSEMPPVPPPRA